MDGEMEIISPRPWRRYPPPPSVVSVPESEPRSSSETSEEKEELDLTADAAAANNYLNNTSSLPPPTTQPFRRDSDPCTWDPLAKVSPKIDPNKKPDKPSMCPHCRRVEASLAALSPLEPLPVAHYYRFRDEENRTARVYPDPPEIKYELNRTPFLCLLPLIVMNLAYLSWLIADLCYTYGPYERYKNYFTSPNLDLNRGMEIFAGVFLFITNMALVCKLVFRGPHYNGPTFSQASRGDKKWIARLAIFSCLPMIMLIIVAAIHQHLPMVLSTYKPIPDCENLGYPTRLQFHVLDYDTVRGNNHTGMSNNVTISNSTHSATLKFDTIYDPEQIQTSFVLRKQKGDINNVTANYFLGSRQYTLNWHTLNETNNILPEYFGGSWQESPGLRFENLDPPLESKKVDKWQIKAFSAGSYLELFARGSGVDEKKKKAWLRTLDRKNSNLRTYMEACTMGGVDEVNTLVPAGVFLIEFAKDLYDTTQ
ncbi:hypothetical protein ABW21_db0208192 [Orbilia brochopaga]|nr:hypothetical protein ABW21_db0208192 [Drechslerella brochopaga]